MIFLNSHDICNDNTGLVLSNFISSLRNESHLPHALHNSPFPIQHLKTCSAVHVSSPERKEEAIYLYVFCINNQIRTNKTGTIQDILYAFATSLGPDFVRDCLRRCCLSFPPNWVGSWLSALAQSLSGISWSTLFFEKQAVSDLFLSPCAATGLW